ncbi:hypothetical protein MKEN_00185300 [Mycena kentingensis (nom. inval.)]|nr:hypothetical protein MKEN_00185300 [Mycena kentingensis (nom. inval.)]
MTFFTRLAFALTLLGALLAPVANAATMNAGLLQVRQSPVCTAPPLDDCSFYACLEPKFNCGPEGYPIGFGQKFCNKFSAARNELSAEGQQWMIKTMNCLQVTLVPELAISQTCDTLESKALDRVARKVLP